MNNAETFLSAHWGTIIRDKNHLPQNLKKKKKLQNCYKRGCGVAINY